MGGCCCAEEKEKEGEHLLVNASTGMKRRKGSHRRIREFKPLFDPSEQAIDLTLTDPEDTESDDEETKKRKKRTSLQPFEDEKTEAFKEAPEDEKTEVRVYTKKSGIPFAGNGLYARRHFKKHDNIIQYVGRELTQDEFEALDNTDYVVEIEKGRRYIDGRNTLAGSANTARSWDVSPDGSKATNNADIWRDKATGLIWLKATKQIHKDQEIFVKYGNQYHNTKSRRQKPEMISINSDDSDLDFPEIDESETQHEVNPSQSETRHEGDPEDIESDTEPSPDTEPPLERKSPIKSKQSDVTFESLPSWRDLEWHSGRLLRMQFAWKQVANKVSGLPLWPYVDNKYHKNRTKGCMTCLHAQQQASGRRGIFANHEYKKGEKIIPSAGREITLAELEKVYSYDYHYKHPNPGDNRLFANHVYDSARILYLGNGISIDTHYEHGAWIEESSEINPARPMVTLPNGKKATQNVEIVEDPDTGAPWVVAIKHIDADDELFVRECYDPDKIMDRDSLSLGYVVSKSISQPSILEPKFSEPKFSEPSVLEPRLLEPSVLEPRVREPRVREPRVREPRVREPKTLKPKFSEPRVRESTVREPRIREPRSVGTETSEETLELRVAHSTIPFIGQGLFAKRNFRKGENIAEYDGPRLNFEEFKALEDHSYILELETDKLFIDGRYDIAGKANMVRKGNTRSDGSEAHNNADFQISTDRKHAFLHATEDIQKGDEIFANYGTKYWRYMGYGPKQEIDFTNESDVDELPPTNPTESAEIASIIKFSDQGRSIADALHIDVGDMTKKGLASNASKQCLLVVLDLMRSERRFQKQLNETTSPTYINEKTTTTTCLDINENPIAAPGRGVWLTAEMGFLASQLIGRGTHKIVYEVLRMKDHHMFVIAEYRNSSSIAAQREIQFYSIMGNQPRLAYFYEHTTYIEPINGQRHTTMRMTAYEGNLTAHLQKRDKPTSKERLRIALDLSRAVNSLHTMSYCHLDIKPENVLIEFLPDDVEDENKVERAVLSDFYQVSSFNRVLSEDRGTEGYRAPELVSSSEEKDIVATPSMDIYSLGRLYQKDLLRKASYLEDDTKAMFAQMTSTLPSQRPLSGQVMNTLAKEWSRMIRRETTKRKKSRKGSPPSE